MVRLLEFVKDVIWLYLIVVFAAVVMSWLIQFRVIGRTPILEAIGRALDTLTEPLLSPIRRVLPSLGPIDISPIVLWLALIFLSNVVIGDCYSNGRAQGFLMPLVCEDTRSGTPLVRP